MTCEWRNKLDLYADGELPAPERTQVEAHIRTCTSCAAEAVGRMQLKRSVHVAAANAFRPSHEFRLKIASAVAPKRRFSPRWLPTLAFSAAMAMAVFTAVVLLKPNLQRLDFLAEAADLHVSTLASANPVDVVSTDRHTVKPWFEGKLPFTFDLPELQNTDFRLIGGSMAYVGQRPAAHLLFGIRKHEISVFVFQEPDQAADVNPRILKRLAFNEQTWSANGLRYIVISSAGPQDIAALSDLMRAAAAH
jgi:anti-sigma factor RsiW